MNKRIRVYCLVDECEYKNRGLCNIPVRTITINKHGECSQAEIRVELEV